MTFSAQGTYTHLNTDRGWSANFECLSDTKLPIRTKKYVMIQGMTTFWPFTSPHNPLVWQRQWIRRFLRVGLADPGFRVPGLPVFFQTRVFRCPKTRVIGFIFGQAFTKHTV